MNIKEVQEYYESLSEEFKLMVDDIMFSTMNMCSELIDEPIYFNDSKDYSSFREMMLFHLMNGEYYDYDSKEWIKTQPIIPNNNIN